MRPARRSRPARPCTRGRRTRASTTSRGMRSRRRASVATRRPAATRGRSRAARPRSCALVREIPCRAVAGAPRRSRARSVARPRAPAPFPGRTLLPERARRSAARCPARALRAAPLHIPPREPPPRPDAGRHRAPAAPRRTTCGSHGWRGVDRARRTSQRCRSAPPPFRSVAYGPESEHEGECAAGARLAERYRPVASHVAMRIAFVHFPGRLPRLDAARSGNAPTEFLFGAVELERAGHTVRHYEVDPARPVSRVLVRLVDANAGRGHLPPHLGAATLAQTRALLPALNDVDVVVATTTATAMALAVWRRLGRLRRPLVGIVAGLHNNPWRATRRRSTLLLLRQMHTVLYGKGELAELVRLGLEDRVHVVPFGVDTDLWTPGAGEIGDEVLAIGNDGHRDWETLLAAAPSVPAPIRILTRREPPASLPPNVSWEPADWYTQVLSDEEVRALYRRAAVVAVPTRDVPQPSGQSVTLQAMACGRPVVLSRTRGLWAPETLREGDNIVLATPGDPADLARSLRLLLDDRRRADAIGAAARASVLDDASTDDYAAALLEVCRSALARP